MTKVTMLASGIRLTKQIEPNDIYMTLTMRMQSTRPNGNGCAVTEGFIDRIIAESEKYHCLPLCADYEKLKDGRVDTLGHNYDPESGTFLTNQIGAFHAFTKVNDEYGVSLIGEARVAKRDHQVCDALAKLFALDLLCVSFEILAAHTGQVDGVTVIDAAEGNELIGMAIVSTPAYPEAKALAMVAEEEKGVTEDMDQEQVKRMAEQEARLKIAEEQAKETEDENEELRKKREEDDRQKKEREEKEASLNQQMAEKDTAIAERDAKISELEARVAELEGFKSEAETLRAEKVAAELKVKQDELTKFAELNGLDAKDEIVAKAIAEVDYPALMAEAMKAVPTGAKGTLAPYALSGKGIKTGSEYGGLLDSAEQ